MAQEKLCLNYIDTEIKVIDKTFRRKINYQIDTNHFISIFKNNQMETVINIRKGTCSVTVSKEMWGEICDLKESVLLCVSFIDGE